MTSPQVQQLIAEMSKRAADYRGLGGSVKLDFGDAGSILIDSRTASISDGAGKTADTTVSCGLDTFERMGKGELDQTSAFMQGKLRVLGDMALAMKLGPVLQKAARG
jgi:putative sterol carrier protein